MKILSRYEDIYRENEQEYNSRHESEEMSRPEPKVVKVQVVVMHRVHLHYMPGMM